MADVLAYNGRSRAGPQWGEACGARVRVVGKCHCKAMETSVIKIRPRGGESIQQVLKRFKRLCQREGLTREVKRHSYFEKPSEKKRRKLRKAIRRAQMDALEEGSNGRSGSAR